MEVHSASILKCMKLYIAILSGDQVVSFAVLIQLEHYTDSWRYTVYYFQHFEVHETGDKVGHAVCCIRNYSENECD